MIELWNNKKMWLAPAASLIMWVVSVLCFVFGLSFKNPMGIVVGQWDISIFIAFALSISNTIIQLIGNGMDMEKADGVFKVGWYSSYVLGIASNVNALLNILGISTPLLEWVVALSLGSMIEIMPEKLIVVWLKSLTPMKIKNNNSPMPAFKYNKDTETPVEHPFPQQRNGTQKPHKVVAPIFNDRYVNRFKNENKK